MKSNREVKERIYKIARRVYDVDESEPDPHQFAIEEDIWKLLSDLGLPTDNLYTEEQLKQAAQGGATNERIHIVRKLKGRRAKIEEMPKEIMYMSDGKGGREEVRVDSQHKVVGWLDTLISQLEEQTKKERREG